MNANAPTHLDLKKDRGLTVRWADGTGSYYSIAYLRRMSPSADMRELRRRMAESPLTVLPAMRGSDGGPLTAIDAELVGHYAIRIRFSDGHATGLYTWEYLREIDPNRGSEGDDPTRHATPRDLRAHDDPLGLGGGGPGA